MRHESSRPCFFELLPFDNLIRILPRTWRSATRGNRFLRTWTLGFPDPKGMESAIPFPRWRATFLHRDLVHEAVPCPFAKEIDACEVPPRKESCVFYCRWR
jgi:hypothetical protein